VAKLMSIDAANMIALQCRRRLQQFIRLRYAKQGEIQLSRADTKKLTESCYRVKREEIISEACGTVSRLTNEWDDTDDIVELELRDWLGKVPWESSIRKSLCHKISNMLSWMECVQRWYPKTKGTRLYSLLPLGSPYSAAFMKINASVLHGLCGRIYKQHAIVLLDIPDEHVRTERYYQVNRETLLWKVFVVSALEPANASSRSR
jgi:hypothetical protein